MLKKYWKMFCVCLEGDKSKHELTPIITIIGGQYDVFITAE
jgi:hypothetical protein